MGNFSLLDSADSHFARLGFTDTSVLLGDFDELYGFNSIFHASPVDIDKAVGFAAYVLSALDCLRYALRRAPNMISRLD